VRLFEHALLRLPHASRGIVPALLGLVLLGLAAVQAASAREPFQFVVTLDEPTAQQALPSGAGAAAGITGRLYVFLSQRDAGEPRFGPNWFKPEPFFGVDVRGVRPGGVCRVDQQADGSPTSLAKLPKGRYRVQAILDHDFYCQDHARGVGNFYSEVATLDYDPDTTGPLDLRLTKVVAEEPFPESKRVHEVALRSELLSRFHGREVIERAGVALPASYLQQPERRYPVVYEIPGFGGTHRMALRYATLPPAEDDEVEFIRVMLSGNCKWGHHVYADSATNGPRGEALIRELIPHIDATFRTIADPSARFLTGHSSGGWSSLWLQVTYPDFFGGVWSTSPDPVDFRDFQQVDLYADPPLSLYVDPQGNDRPIARRGSEPVLWFASFGRMDDVLSRGGQLRSFEAVFSPLGTDGLPKRLWDRATGRIDPAVARAWQEYDIRLKLERNWRELKPKLRGKLHVTTGSLDTFYLNGAVEKLARSLKQLGSDAQIAIVPGKGHGDLLTPDLRRQMRREMSAAFKGREAAK
jgi:S-formylglutathione hydrolase FrmB